MPARLTEILPTSTLAAWTVIALLAGLFLAATGTAKAAEKPSAARKPLPAVKRAPLPALPAKPLREIVVNGRKYLDIKAVGAKYNFRFRAGKKGKEQTATLTTPKGESIVFIVAKQVFQIGGLNATLSYPVLLQKGVFLLEKTDYTEFLEPLLTPSNLPRKTIRTIVVDAGHGGKDQGAASSDRILEKNLNLLLARKVVSILKVRGYKVFMTRNADTTVTLDERCRIAAAKKPDLFLSIHCNAATDASLQGIEVFLANPPGVPSFGTTNIGKTGAATPFQKTSALWAYHTQHALIDATKATDRGIKRKQFKVIIDSPAPAMLVECGFVSNAAECAKLRKSDYQDKLAVAICDGVDKLRNTLRPKK